MPCYRQGGGLLREAGVQLGLFGLARFQALGICNCQFQGFAQFAGVGMQLACNAAGVVELGELMLADALFFQHGLQLFNHVRPSVMPRRNGAGWLGGANGAVGQPLGCEPPRYLDERITYALIVLFGKAVPAHCLKYDS